MNLMLKLIYSSNNHNNNTTLRIIFRLMAILHYKRSVMKLFTTILFIIVAVFGFSQQNHFRFQRLLTDSPTKTMPFAVKYENTTLQNLLKEKNVIVKSSTSKWIYITANPTIINELIEAQKINQFHYEFGAPQVLNDTSRVTHKINEVHSGLAPLPDSYTGKDVIMGYIDTGIDFNHYDFKDVDSNTRVLYYWDHSLGFDAARTPAKYGYGQVWDSTDINNGTITSMDNSAHGTTVSGAGSGNGLANGTNKGMAPDSKIVIVETNFSLPNWTLTVADGCDFIFDVADSLGLPAVVNLSLGDYLGSHDGLDPAALYIDSLLEEKPGRLVVCAGGNSGNRGKYHLGGTVTVDTSFVWFKPNTSGGAAFGANSIYFDLWADSSNMADVDFAIGADLPSPNYGFRGHTSFLNTGVNLDNGGNLPLVVNGNTLATFDYYHEVVDGRYHLEIVLQAIDSSAYLYRFMTTGTGEYDLWSGAWLGLSDMETNLPTNAIVPDIIHYQMPDTLQTLVSSWATSPKVITVANMQNKTQYIDYNSNTYTDPNGTPKGKLSINSSKGPNRLDVQKPDVTAAGDLALAACPIWLQNSLISSNPGMLALGGEHVRNGGTSMASPVIAGIAALYLEKCAKGTWQDFKNIITSTADSDAFTGTLPNYGYGHGKANAYEALIQTNYTIQLLADTVICATPQEVTTSIPLDSTVWYNSASTPSIFVDTPDQVYMTGFNNLGCKSQSDTIEFIQGTVPATPVISYSNGSFISTLGPNYQWYFNGSEIVGETSQITFSGANGYYYVAFEGPEGCLAFSDSIQLSLDLAENEGSDITIFPNPVKNQLQINSEISLEKFRIIDVSGRIINGYQTFPNSGTLNLDYLKSGMYILETTSKDKIFNTKFYKE